MVIDVYSIQGVRGLSLPVEVVADLNPIDLGISLSSAQPGDLAFYNDTSHVGIVGGKDASGNVLVIHCSSGYNNVVVTTGGFGFAVRPNCY